MRMWLSVLLGVVLLGYVLVSTLGSAMALSDIANRPILALTCNNGAVRSAVQAPCQPARSGDARNTGGQDFRFG
jgi:hypothetical protein